MFSAQRNYEPNSDLKMPADLKTDTMKFIFNKVRPDIQEFVMNEMRLHVHIQQNRNADCIYLGVFLKLFHLKNKFLIVTSSAILAGDLVEIDRQSKCRFSYDKS